MLIRKSSSKSNRRFQEKNTLFKVTGSCEMIPLSFVANDETEIDTERQLLGGGGED